MYQGCTDSFPVYVLPPHFNKSCPLLPNSAHFYPFPPLSPSFLHFYPFLSTYSKFLSIFIHCMKFFPLDILPPQCILGHLHLDIQKIKVYQGGRPRVQIGLQEVLPTWPTLFVVTIAHFFFDYFWFFCFFYLLTSNFAHFNSSQGVLPAWHTSPTLFGVAIAHFSPRWHPNYACNSF